VSNANLARLQQIVHEEHYGAVLPTLRGIASGDAAIDLPPGGHSVVTLA
jgi:hypothetical protein